MTATDDFTGGSSTLDAAPAALGRALRLDYTWSHPEDGAQAGTLLLGVPGDDGAVTAGWVDSWHQAVPAFLSGRGGASSALLGYEYAPGWHWEVEVRVAGSSVELVMRNVVPAKDDTPSVTYDVMRASWS
jgi:hypothetical protein